MRPSYTKTFFIFYLKFQLNWLSLTVCATSSNTTRGISAVGTANERIARKRTGAGSGWHWQKQEKLLSSDCPWGRKGVREGQAVKAGPAQGGLVKPGLGVISYHPPTPMTVTPMSFPPAVVSFQAARATH